MFFRRGILNAARYIAWVLCMSWRINCPDKSYAQCNTVGTWIVLLVRFVTRSWPCLSLSRRLSCLDAPPVTNLWLRVWPDIAIAQSCLLSIEVIGSLELGIFVFETMARFLFNRYFFMYESYSWDLWWREQMALVRVIHWLITDFSICPIPPWPP